VFLFHKSGFFSSNNGEENMSTQKITETALYLTFKLGDEVFALDVSQVREVLDLTTITKVPRAPEFMRGVINVRGSVVPVVDMRVKFGLPEIDDTPDTRIIVMELALDGEMSTLGALADSVHEVVEMEPGQIEPPPKIGMRWKTEFIRGIGKRNDDFIIILDINRVFSVDELALVDASAEVAPESVTESDAKESVE
jgi:purine-binding chemotaxis protein CheW